jgi:hypothetical protein
MTGGARFSLDTLRTGRAFFALGSLRACWTGCALRAFSAVGPGGSCGALGARQALGAWSARRT